MSHQYRFCQNCGASLTPTQGYCFHCGAKYIEPSEQQPGSFEQFKPEQPAVPGTAGPYVIPQNPGVLPPLEARTPFPSQGQGYVPPPAPPPFYPVNYAQQAQVPPGPGQRSNSSPPPPNEPEQRVSPGILIILAVVTLLLLAGLGSFFYNLGQHKGAQPGSTPTPIVTPAPTHTPTPVPTHTPRPGPTRTPGSTPTSTSLRAPTTGEASGEGPFWAALARPCAWQPFDRRT
jgi:hypothetical protein